MTVLRGQVRSALISGEYIFKARYKDGTVIEGRSQNYVPNVGRAAFLNAYFGIGSITPLYMSLVGSVQQSFVVGQYEQSNTFTNVESLNWRELQNYADTNRKTATWSTDAATGRIETDFETFTMTSTPNSPFGDIEGIFLASGQAKTGLTSSASGNDELFSVAPWETQAVRQAKSGQYAELDAFDVKYRLRLFFGGPEDEVSASVAGDGGATILGRNDMLNVALRGTSITSQWYLGLVDATSFSTIRETDTLSSHAGWNELSGATFEQGRFPLTFASTSTDGQNLSDVVTLTMNTPGILRGLFLTDSATSNTGLLHSVIQFTKIFTFGRTFRRYDRLFVQYGLAMADISYREKKGVI